MEGVTLTDDKLIINKPELAQEVVKKIISGILKITRAFVPTKENLEGKKEHCDVAIREGIIYINSDHSVCLCQIQLNLTDFLTKKSILKPIFENNLHLINGNFNYGLASPWLKLHDKNIKSIVFSESELKLIVVDNIIELNLSPTLQSNAYIDTVCNIFDSRISEDSLIYGPFELPEYSNNLTVLEISEDGIIEKDFLTNECKNPQIKLKTKLIPKGDSFIFAYSDLSDGGPIIRISSSNPSFTSDQFFKVLLI
jgi:hypothetical protein